MWKIITKTDLEKTKSEFALQGKEMQHHAMASEIILTTLGPEWWSKNCTFPYQGDKFLITGDSEVGRYEHQHRIIYLGHMLYALKDCKGFETFIQALKTRDLKACFWELNVAWIIFDNGYFIEFVKTSGVKGEDYDLSVSKRQLSFAIECKSRDSDEIFNLTTLKNALVHSRKQLPKNKRGVIFLSMPANINEELSFSDIQKCFHDFFRNTRRVVCVLLYWKKWENLVQGKKLTSYFKKFENHYSGSPVLFNLKRIEIGDKHSQFQPSFDS